MDVDITFTGVPVSELGTAREFFERLFGRPADVLVAADEVMWRVSASAWLYVVVDAARAGNALAALSVSDLEATLSELHGRGLRPHGVADVGDSGRKATLFDPDGNSIAIIEVAR